MRAPSRSLRWFRARSALRGAALSLSGAVAVACGPPAPTPSVVADASVRFAPFMEPMLRAPDNEPPVGYQSLDWPQFDVSAHLDSTGTLHVRERQVIRLSGDWNGGERVFDTRLGQRFDLVQLLRVDSLTGTEVPLVYGAIDSVDGYAWAESRTLRWRSRRPDDPAFDNTYITYILEYRYADILLPVDDGYRLDHEFAFRNRAGNIERFSLVLTLDDVWQAPLDFAGRWQKELLEPGVSFVVNTDLTYRGEGRPSNVAHGTDPAVAYGFVAALTFGLVLLTGRFVRDERALGRFEPTESRAIDDAWLHRHLLHMLPEVAGTVWDDSVGPPEVAATLARLVAEGKLSSTVKSEGKSIFRRDMLQLTLVARRETLTGHERALVDALFESFERTTDTTSLRRRYASTGFDPAGLIRAELMRRVLALPDAGTTLPPVRRWPLTLALHLTGLMLFILAIRTRALDALLILGGIGIALAICIVGYSQAVVWRKRVLHPGPHLLRVLVPVFGLVAGLLWLTQQRDLTPGVLTYAALTAFGLGFGKAMLDNARSPHGRDRIRLRKRLVAAREHFRRELASPTPALEQAWYPYLLAFGLHRQVNRWFTSFGALNEAGTSSSTGLRTSSASAGLSSAGGNRSWGSFGGGGGFAGAGATVAFGAAVSGFSSGVSAPSSSSSGGGSSSSGGSSGGGGGGGW